MKRILRLSIACLVIDIVAGGDKTCDQQMKEAGVIPDFAESIGCGNLKVCGEYGKIQCANAYAPSLLLNPPTLYYNNTTEKSGNYTLIFFGESSADPSVNMTVQWLVHNIPKSDFARGFHGQSGKVVAHYISPVNSGGPARYVFLTYLQKNNRDNIHHFGLEDRKNFNVKNFAEEKNLGNPDAGLCFILTAANQLMNNAPLSDEGGRNECDD